MPKAFEIGISGSTRGSHAQSSYGYQSSPSRPSGVPSPRNREEEDTDLQRAINASLQESRQYLATKGQSDSYGAPAPPPAAPVADFDLMGLEGPPAGPPQPALMNAPATNASYNSMPPSYGAPPPAQYAAQPQYASQPLPNAYNQSPGYASQPPPPANAYQSPPPAAPGALVVSHVPSQPYAVPPPATPTYQAPPAYAGPPSVAPSYASPPPAAPVAYGAPPPGPAYGAPPPQAAVPTGNLFAPPPVDAFAPRASATSDPYGLASPVYEDPFAPKPPPPPTRQDITNSVRNAFVLRRHTYISFGLE